MVYNDRYIDINRLLTLYLLWHKTRTGSRVFIMMGWGGEYYEHIILLNTTGLMYNVAHFFTL